MDARRRLARLTTKGAWFEVGGAGGGAGDGVLIPSSEIAAALGMGSLSRRAYLLGLAVWAQDERAALQLILAMSPALEYRLAMAGHSADRLFSLCHLAVFEFVNPKSCSACSGEGWVRASAFDQSTKRLAYKTVPCEVCGGKGRVSRSQRECASFIGVSRAQYRNRWEERVVMAREILSQAEVEVLIHVRVQMIDDDVLYDIDRLAS